MYRLFLDFKFVGADQRRRTPPSFQFAGSLRSEKLAEQVPVNFSVEDLKTVDAWRVSQGAPLRVAKSIPTSFDIADSGDWISLPDGSQVWQLHLQAKERSP